MLIFERQSKFYIFIHIPKNGGKYIRNNLINDKNNKIIKSYWNLKSNFDLAHIPYFFKYNFIKENIDYNYFTYKRNPYDRIISAYFYKNSGKKINDFKNFVKNALVLYNFDMNFDKDIIHYYPQYLFICDENLNIPKEIQIYQLKNPKRYILSKYFDNECIEIINKIYMKDFILLDYPIITDFSM